MKQSAKKKSLDHAFWAKFAQNYWERKPAIFSGITSPILNIDSDHIFQLLVRYSEHCRQTNTTEGMKFYIDGQPQYFEDVLRYLPVPRDRSLTGYHRRMSQQFKDYCLVCDELLQVSQEKWDLLGNFMLDLYQEVGFPNRYAEIGLYLGNYRKTPFGVHVDGCGVFSFPVVGTKRFRLWDPRIVKKHPDLEESHHYAPYKKQSQLLQANPGDMTYWPSSYWHIAESNGSFSATWSLGVWVNEPFQETLAEMLKPFLPKMLSKDADHRMVTFRQIHDGTGRIHQLPELFERSIAILSALPERELKDLALKFWLARTSKKGFKNPPLLPPEERLTPKDQVRAKSEHPILWAQLSQGLLCLAVNGKLIELPESKAVSKLIQDLNSGRAFALAASSPDEKQILHRLYELNALKKLENRKLDLATPVSGMKQKRSPKAKLSTPARNKKTERKP